MSDDQQVAEPTVAVEPDLVPDAQEAVAEAEGNAWDKVTAAIEQFGEDGLSPVETEGEPEGEPEPDAPLGEVEQDPVPDDGEPQVEELEEREGTESEATLAYRARDLEGNDVPIDIPEGTTISFRADGHDLSVSSVDELVELAQKGAYFDRRMREVSDREKSFGERETGYKAKLEDAEKLLEQVLFDDEAYEKVRTAAEKWRDPEYREGQKARATLEQNTQDQQRAVQDQAQQFWNGIGEHTAAYFDKTMAEFDFLRAEDKQAVLGEFFKDYDSLRQTARTEYLGQVREGFSEQDAIKAAEQKSFQHFSRDNLRSYMKRTNDRYAQRVPAPTPEADAEAHNRHVDTKLEQKRTRRSVRKGGSAPDPAPAPKPAPTTYEERLELMRDEFSALRSRHGE